MNNYSIKNIVIFGSKISGLISALMIKSSFPDFNCSVIRNPKDEVKYLEAVPTEELDLFIRLCNIDRIDFLIHTDGIPKEGIFFQNWFNNDIDFFHSLSDKNVGKYFDDANWIQYSPYPSLLARQLLNKKNKDIDLVYKIPKLGKHVFTNSQNNLKIDKEILSIQTFNQFNFDNQKMFNYLTKICINRGIKIFEDNIIDVKMDDNQNIVNLIGNENKYDSDFLIDCSDNDSIIKKNKNHWVDLSDYMPCNSILIMKTKNNNSLFPFTISRGMKSGWVYSAPTKKSWDNRYIFNNQIDKIDDILKEFSNYCGVRKDNLKQISFNSGYFKKCLIHNVFSVESSSLFFDPIESSTLAITIKSIMNLINNLKDYFHGFKIHEKINKFHEKMIMNVYFFMKFHYIKKFDNLTDKFWSSLKYLKTFDWEKEIIEKWKKRIPSNLIDDEIFSESSVYHDINFLQVGYGTHFFENDILKKFFIDNNSKKINYPIRINQETTVSCESISKYYEICYDYIFNRNNIYPNDLILGNKYCYTQINNF